MTIQLMNQIQSAEYGSEPVDRTVDPRFVPSAHFSLREFGARVIRTGAHRGLRLADRLDGHYQPA